MLQFTLTGRLAADPELTTYGTDNTPMARLRVASNQPGSERTDFFDVAVFGTPHSRRSPPPAKATRCTSRAAAANTSEHRQRRDPRGISLAARSVEHTPRTGQPAATAQHTHTATAPAAR